MAIQKSPTSPKVRGNTSLQMSTSSIAKANVNAIENISGVANTWADKLPAFDCWEWKSEDDPKDQINRIADIQVINICTIFTINTKPACIQPQHFAWLFITLPSPSLRRYVRTYFGPPPPSGTVHVISCVGTLISQVLQ